MDLSPNPQLGVLGTRHAACDFLHGSLGSELGSSYLHGRFFPAEPSSQPWFSLKTQNPSVCYIGNTKRVWIKGVDVNLRKQIGGFIHDRICVSPSL